MRLSTDDQQGRRKGAGGAAVAAALTARSCLATSIRPRPFQYFSTSFFGLATVVVVQVTVVPSGWVTVVVVLISIRLIVHGLRVVLPALQLVGSKISWWQLQNPQF